MVTFMKVPRIVNDAFRYNADCAHIARFSSIDGSAWQINLRHLLPHGHWLVARPPAARQIGDSLSMKPDRCYKTTCMALTVYFKTGYIFLI